MDDEAEKTALKSGLPCTGETLKLLATTATSLR